MPATFLTWSAGIVPYCALSPDSQGAHGSCSYAGAIVFGKFDVTELRPSPTESEPEDIRYEDDAFHDNQPEKTEPPLPTNNWWSNLSGETGRAVPSLAALRTGEFTVADGGGGGSWTGIGPPLGRSASWFTVY